MAPVMEAWNVRRKEDRVDIVRYSVGGCCYDVSRLESPWLRQHVGGGYHS